MSRLSCPSRGLRLRMLFGRAQVTLWASLAVAVGLHGLLSQAAVIRTKERLVKPLTTQFIKREPRLTKPLEMKKEPLPKRRRMKRTMVTVKPEASPARASARGRPPELVPILARPTVAVSRMAHAAGAAMEPEVAAREIMGTREDENVVDMCLEMLDVDALDYGRYPALVIEDPSDKRNIRGFLHFSPFFLSGELLPPPSWQDLPHVGLLMHWHNTKRMRDHAGLVRWLNEMTQIKASYRGRVVVDSSELFDMPWVFLNVPWYSPAYTEQEMLDLGRYMLSGGFVFTDTWHTSTGIYQGRPSWQDPSSTLVREALRSQGYGFGRDWGFESLPDEHPICHCFFDFSDGPPKYEPYDPYCSVVNIDRRTVCLGNNQSYDDLWDLWPRPEISKARLAATQTRVVHFTINTIVFALTQEGSIAQRVMDSFRGY